MRNLLLSLRIWLHSLWKVGGDLFDLFKPRGWVEARLYYADGPKKGQLARVVHGRNIVTSWLSSGGAAPTSGRDLLRRKIVPASFSGSLASDANAVIGKIQLGSGTAAETTADTALDTPIVGTDKAVTSVTFDAINPYVTFSVEYDETEANVTISEASLLSNRTPSDFLARKTFGAFTKTSEYTLEIRWTIRF